MILKNKKNLFQAHDVSIMFNNEEYTFRMLPLPINFLDKIETLCPTPEPPKSTEPLRDAKGRFLRDEKGMLLYEKLYDNADYKTKLRESQLIQSAIMIYESLKSDNNIDFNVGEYKDNVDFYRKLSESIKINIPLALYTQILEKINSLSSQSITTLIDDSKKN